jgi:hypothetical protein
MSLIVAPLQNFMCSGREIVTDILPNLQMAAIHAGRGTEVINFECRVGRLNPGPKFTLWRACSNEGYAYYAVVFVGSRRPASAYRAFIEYKLTAA